MSENTPSAQRTATHSAIMKSPVTTLCVFSAALITAHSLQCLLSVSMVPGDYSKKAVEGTTVDCKSHQDACIRIFFVIDKRSDKKLKGYMYQMRCAQQSECDNTASMTTAGFFIFYSTTCCNNKDECVPPQPALPERSLVKNGVTCPACYVEKQDPCVPETAMACTGEETQCVFLNATMYKAYNAYSSGCATKNIFMDNGEFINTISFITKFLIYNISRKQLQVGNFLWCHECQEAHSSSCAKYQALCPPDRDVCLSEMRRITEDPSRKLTMQAVRRCGYSHECDVDGTLTGRGRTISIKTSCCNTDMCNPSDVAWSLKRKKTNGKTCPVYSSLNKYYPDADIVECLGDETHCVNFTSLITEGSVSTAESLHGCAMASICEKRLVKEYQSASSNILIMNDIACSKGTMIMDCLPHLMMSLVAVLMALRD